MFLAGKCSKVVYIHPYLHTVHLLTGPRYASPVSSVGRAWDSYIANHQCSSNPRVVGSSPTSGEATFLSVETCNLARQGLDRADTHWAGLGVLVSNHVYQSWK